MSKYRTWAYDSIMIIASKDTIITKELEANPHWVQMETTFPISVFVDCENYKVVLNQELPQAVLQGLAEMMHS